MQKEPSEGFSGVRVRGGLDKGSGSADEESGCERSSNGSINRTSVPLATMMGERRNQR